MSTEHPMRSEPVPHVHHIRGAPFPCMVKRPLALAGIHRSSVEPEACRLLLRGCFPNPPGSETGWCAATWPPWSSFAFLHAKALAELDR